ncbi:hypothetical protein CN980_30160, partial [Bacillus cereus]
MHYKDWMDMCEDGESGETFADLTVQEGVTIAVSIAAAVLSVSFPVTSAGLSIISVLIPYWWPETAGAPGTPSAQVTWEKFMSAAEILSNKQIVASKRSDAIARWQGIQTLGRDYFQAQCDWLQDQNNELKKSKLRDAFDDVEDYLKVSMPFFGAQGFEIPMLAMYAQAANMHLILLRDVVQNGLNWGFQQYQVDRYYSNTDPFLGNPGLLQLIEGYTEYCVQWYNTDLRQQYENNRYNWDAFNDFRRNMTIMVLDIVALWPTYDPKRYPLPTKSQLTRTVYTDLIGYSGDFEYQQIAIERAERELVQRPGLFTWLREIIFKLLLPTVNNSLAGREMVFNYTASPDGYEENKGNPGQTRETLVIPAPDVKDDIWRIGTQIYYHPLYNVNIVEGWSFSFTRSLDQKIHWMSNPSYRTVMQGLSCHGPSMDSCNLCSSNSPCRSITPNYSLPCNDKEVYSHRFSYLGAGLKSDLTTLTYFSYGWTHISADFNNLIDAEKITQIPAVKASSISGNARVIRGPGSTGGDLVEFSTETTGGTLNIRYTPPEGTSRYQLRLRYASNVDNTTITVNGRGRTYADITTTDITNLTYDKFGYVNINYILGHTDRPSDALSWFSLGVSGTGSGTFLLDKIEFIP